MKFNHTEETKKILSLKSTTHGLSRVPEYTNWVHMRARCRDKSNKYYGGRGIKVCKRWQSFENFFADMGSKPTQKHTIDRVDVSGDYEPSNCRWITQQEQCIARSKYNTVSQETRDKIATRLRKGKYVACIICQSKVWTSPSKTGNRFCSNKCVGSFNTGNKYATKC